MKSESNKYSHHHELRIVREKNRISNVPSALGISPYSSPAGIFSQLYLYFMSNILAFLADIFWVVSILCILIFPFLHSMIYFVFDNSFQFYA